MKNLKNLYLEHEARISTNLPEIKTVDLWSEQVSFMAEEHPFKAPAVFFAYRVLNADDMAEKLQQLQLQVDVYLFYETFADTNRGAKRQQKALDFLDLLTKINACFHGTAGTYYAEMRRTGFNPVETGGAGMLYVQRYTLTMIDDSAQKLYNTMKFDTMQVEVAAAEIVTEANGTKLYSDIEV